ncbi:hypothetical protein RD792_002683 [Penstemon davidsonii]|uniref:Thymidine kinase n=1 Tax=Penstemon davidsonii TaxID=160366 RepID=A0ABR0DRY7_9LAMI|nr:hypothetical protein RD792_002683 [Penstemon davidsonii]
MLAGKTTTLLQRMKLASRNGRRSFGSVLDIIPIARSEVCGENAVFTLRKTDETRTEVIAGAEVYMPVCRIHYISGQMVKKLSHFSSVL